MKKYTSSDRAKLKKQTMKEIIEESIIDKEIPEKEKKAASSKNPQN